MHKNNSNNKLSLISCLTVAVFLSLVFTCQAAQFLTVSKDNVNVRKGPSTQNPVVMELFEGWPLKVMSQKGEWYEIVDYENDKGWIHSTLVRKNDTVIVNVNKTGNMRSGPGKNNSVVAEVERGVVLKKLGSEGKWVKVKHSQGTVGWIYQTLLWP